MTFRKKLKYWLYGSCPGLAGSFPYYGTRLHFPKGSLSFRAACEQGIFEADNVRVLQALVKPETFLFDVGANIGLMSAPVLYHVRDARVVAFEPSPNTLPFLQRSIEMSPFRERWALVPKAVGAEEGRAAFSLASQENSLFDGLRGTGRVLATGTVEVELTTVDVTWKELGSPVVSVIKCDVEGAELAVLAGARQCLAAMRPAVLTEWNIRNLSAYVCPPAALLNFAREACYRVYALPVCAPVISARELEVQMAFTENFLLLPQEGL
jgi:FkbM family methyltransferase